jgi:predicted nuclease of predicted toxin-antitoxin system
MQLVADENVPQPVIRRLRSDGFTVLAISEVAAGISDVRVMQASHERAFILITQDRDFGELAVRDGLPVAGVILLELERLSLGSQIERISRCLADNNEVWEGNFSVVEPGRVRRRALQAAP